MAKEGRVGIIGLDAQGSMYPIGCRGHGAEHGIEAICDVALLRPRSYCPQIQACPVMRTTSPCSEAVTSTPSSRACRTNSN